MQNRHLVLAAYAHQHRASPTNSEELLWRSALCRGQLGVPFRRQVVLLQRFIVDFFAPSVGLALEIDGPWHQRRLHADESRDRKLVRAGYCVLRLQAELVEHALKPLSACARRSGSLRALKIRV
jgi:very-short-patch-repair endonuclease